MAVEVLARVGIGVVLAWAALPGLAKLARRSRAAQPAQYYRALLLALGIAAALIFFPLVRTASEIVLSALRSNQPLREPGSDSFVRELVSPLISATASAWAGLPWLDLFAAVGGVWLLLWALGLGASLAGHARVRRTYRQAASAPVRVIERAQHIAAELGMRCPPIRSAQVHAAAFSYGVRTPSVVLSARACELSDVELEYVLRHELCHIAHHDTRALCLIDLAQRCFTLHPSLQPLAAEIRLAREARADRAAAGSHRLEYARSLLTIAERLGSRHTTAGLLVSMADTALERRVHMLIHPDRSQSRRSAPWLVLVGLTTSSLVFAAPASLGQRAHAGDRARPASGTVSVEAPTVLTPPFDERRALLEAREGTSPRLSRETIRTTLRGYFPQLRDCFERVRAPLPSASVNMSFVIGRDGSTIDGEVIDKTDPPAPAEAFEQLAQCVDEVRRTMQFPAPEDGIVNVDYPILFEWREG